MRSQNPSKADLLQAIQLFYGLMIQDAFQGGLISRYGPPADCWALGSGLFSEDTEHTVTARLNSKRNEVDEIIWGLGPFTPFAGLPWLAWMPRCSAVRDSCITPAV